MKKSPAEAGLSYQCEGTAQLFRLSAGLCRSAALRSLAGRRLLLHAITLAARARLIGGRLLLRGLLAALRALPTGRGLLLRALAGGGRLLAALHAMLIGRLLAALHALLIGRLLGALALLIGRLLHAALARGGVLPHVHIERRDGAGVDLPGQREAL